MSTPIYCLPTDIKSFGATWSAPAGTINSSFPLTNQNLPYSDKVTKFTGNTGTLRGTIASTALQGVVLVNLGAGLAGSTAVITNGGAMASQNLVIGSVHPDGVSLNAFKDLRGVTAAATAWDVAFSGSSPVAVGKVLLVSTWRDMPALWRGKFDEVKPTNSFMTQSGIVRGNRKNVRFRETVIRFIRDSFRDDYITLRRSSEGVTQPFIIIFDPADQDSMIFCWFPSPTWSLERTEGDVTTWTDTVRELNPGSAI